MDDALQAPLIGARIAAASVLVVDDEPANVAILTRLLKSAGITRVHPVTDPRTAVERFEQTRADLVLLDLHMPFLDGFEVLEQLQALLPADAFLPVIVLTADTTAAARERALRAGAKDFLIKPFDHTEVLLRVRNLLETALLHADVRRRNAELQADLARRAEAERRREEDLRVRRDRVDSVLANGGLRIVYQQVADLRSGAVVGLEALARFDIEPRRSPQEWFEEAAEVGRGPDLELAAARAALAGLSEFPEGAFLSINTSPSTAQRPEMAQMLSEHATDRIVLELTEHLPVEDYKQLMGALDPLRHGGLRIAVDDAGAGYSGLQHVLALNPDIIKLDTALTRGIDEDPARRALATAMVAFAGDIDAALIAEGVESWAEVETLRGLGVGSGQGYRLARPGELPSSVTSVDVMSSADSAGL